MTGATSIPSLSGVHHRRNPLEDNPLFHPSNGFYITPSDVILAQVAYDLSAQSQSRVAYHRAGPRREIMYEPSAVKAAIVTCGGLCPGMNTVIRELVVGLWELYGVREIYGIPAGYRGFYSMEAVKLDPKAVHDWHKKGGTVLRTSRGGFHLHKIVDAIQLNGFNQVEFYNIKLYIKQGS